MNNDEENPKKSKIKVYLWYYTMLLTHLPKQNPLLHLLLQPLTQQKPYNRQLDNILKDYYSKRLTLLPHDY